MKKIDSAFIKAKLKKFRSNSIIQSNNMPNMKEKYK